jgi:hypothetical protein
VAFEEPQTLATFDRTWQDKHEELRLERGEYQGRPTYSLRLYWQTPEGQWRWSAAKPTQAGKTWQVLNLKAKELRALGEALIAAAGDIGDQGGQQRSRTLDGTPRRPPNAKEQASMDKFDAQYGSASRGATDETDLF